MVSQRNPTAKRIKYARWEQFQLSQQMIRYLVECEQSSLNEKNVITGAMGCFLPFLCTCLMNFLLSHRQCVLCSVLDQAFTEKVGSKKKTVCDFNFFPGSIKCPCGGYQHQMNPSETLECSILVCASLSELTHDHTVLASASFLAMIFSALSSLERLGKQQIIPGKCVEFSDFSVAILQIWKSIKESGVISRKTAASWGSARSTFVLCCTVCDRHPVWLRSCKQI